MSTMGTNPGLHIWCFRINPSSVGTQASTLTRVEGASVSAWLPAILAGAGRELLVGEDLVERLGGQDPGAPGPEPGG